MSDVSYFTIIPYGENPEATKEIGSGKDGYTSYCSGTWDSTSDEAETKSEEVKLANFGNRQLIKLVKDLDNLCKKYKEKVDSLFTKVEVISKSIPGPETTKTYSVSLNLIDVKLKAVEKHVHNLNLSPEESKALLELVGQINTEASKLPVSFPDQSKQLEDILSAVRSLKQPDVLKSLFVDELKETITKAAIPASLLQDIATIKKEVSFCKCSEELEKVTELLEVIKSQTKKGALVGKSRVVDYNELRA